MPAAEAAVAEASAERIGRDGADGGAAGERDRQPREPVEVLTRWASGRRTTSGTRRSPSNTTAGLLAAHGDLDHLLHGRAVEPVAGDRLAVEL